LYIKDVNGSPVAYSLKQLRTDNPNISFPSSFPEAVLADFDVYPYVEIPAPEVDCTTHKVSLGAILKIDGVWTQTWDTVVLTQGETCANEDVVDTTTVLADTQVRSLLLDRPAGIEAYINSSVTDLETAKEVLVTLAKALSIISKPALRQ